MYCKAKIKLSKDTWAIQAKNAPRMQEGIGDIFIDGGSFLPVGIVAFGVLADTLAEYKLNSFLNITGRFKANRISHKGKTVIGYQIVADSISEG